MKVNVNTTVSSTPSNNTKVNTTTAEHAQSSKVGSKALSDFDKFLKDEQDRIKKKKKKNY